MKKIIFLLALIIPFRIFSQSLDSANIKVLLVFAHPDDESGCSATVYKLTHDYHAKVDLVCITDGEGGYKYSTLGNDYYGLDLTDPKIGRQYLPTIRKKELMNAGKILGIRNYFFLDQLDDKYGLNPKAPLDTFWNVPLVKTRLKEIMNKETYDFVFCLLPTPGTHAHHKAATILALQTIKDLPENKKPIILGIDIFNLNDTTKHNFQVLDGYPETRINLKVPAYEFDRAMKFGYRNALNYHIVADWEIAEHKSQGTMQLAMGKGDFEAFYYFDVNSPVGIDKTAQLFRLMRINHYPVLQY